MLLPGIGYGIEGPHEDDVLHTAGLLLSMEPIKNLNASVEYARQFGRIQQVPAYWVFPGPPFLAPVNIGAQRSAWATQAMLNYVLPIAEKKVPQVGLLFTYLSGDKEPNSKEWTAWDPMFEDQTPNNIVNALLPNTNIMCWNVKGSMKPVEDITLAANYGYYMLAKRSPWNDVSGATTFRVLGGPYGPYTMDDKRFVGHAFDLTTTYDYTEDVQFGLTFGYFNPGRAFEKGADWIAPDRDGFKSTATQVIGSMKVTF
jgi:hypothetical protein